MAFNPLEPFYPLFPTNVTQAEGQADAKGEDSKVHDPTDSQVKEGNQQSGPDHADSGKETSSTTDDYSPSDKTTEEDFASGKNEEETEGHEQENVTTEETDAENALDEKRETEHKDIERKDSEEEEDDDEGEEEEEEEDDEDDEPAPPAPLYEPVKGEGVSRKDLWDNFTLKATRMTDEEFGDETYDEEDDNIEGKMLMQVKCFVASIQ